MKNRFTKFLFFIAAILIAQSSALAQDILDVPPLDAQNMPTLANVIVGDTMANGDRIPNRVYRLQRGAIYIMSSTINANYSVHLIADGDDSQRPPIIASGKDAGGSNVRPFFKFTGDETTHSFKDIFFQGVDLDRTYDTQWFQGLVFQADDLSVTFEGCIFNAFTGGATQFFGSKRLSAYFRDCTWRNGVWPAHLFVGQQCTFPELPIDTLVVTNSTYFNNNSYWIFQGNSIAKFAVIEHNTIFASLVDVLHLRFTSSINIRSNLFYATHAFGDTPYSRENEWYESDQTAFSVISLYEVPSNILSSVGLAEADRVTNLTHNAWFTPQPIKDYWDGDATISDLVWMNERTTELFENSADHPFFFDDNNVEKDPSFTDTAMDDWVVGQVADFCKNYRQTDSDNGHALDGDGGTNRNYDEQQGVDILTGIQWPLPETLAYTDADLLVGGHDGLPVGDLNWFPAMRDQYVEPTEVVITDVNDVNAPEFSLFPNPAQDQLSVTSGEGIQQLEVFSLLGRKLAVQPVGGLNEATMDVSTLPKGVYIILISSARGTGSKLFVKQ